MSDTLAYSASLRARLKDLAAGRRRILRRLKSDISARDHLTGEAELRHNGTEAAKIAKELAEHELRVRELEAVEALNRTRQADGDIEPPPAEDDAQ